MAVAALKDRAANRPLKVQMTLGAAKESTK